MQEGIHNERNNRCEELNTKVKYVEERISAAQELSAKKFSTLKESLAKFSQELDAERIAREEISEQKSREMEELDKRLQTALEEEQNTRRKSEQKLLRQFEEKTLHLQEEIAAEGKLRVENEYNLRRYLEIDIPKLHDAIEKRLPIGKLWSSAW